MPNLALAEQALRRAELVVVQDAYSNGETLRFADVVLPAAQWAEQHGSFTASDRHITLLNQAVAPPGDALPDWQLVQMVAQHMGYGQRAAVHQRQPDLRRLSPAQRRRAPL